MRLSLRTAAAIAAIATAPLARAAAPTSGSLTLKDAGSTTQNESVTPLAGGGFMVNHLNWGWNFTLNQPAALGVDPNSLWLGVHIEAFPSGFTTGGNSLNVTCTSGCSGGSGGGGGGPVTAVSGAFAAGSISDLGTGSTPAAGTTNAYLKANLADLDQVAAAGAPIAGFAAISAPGVTVAAGRGIAAVCTTPGAIQLQAADGSSISVPVQQGYNQFGFAIVQVVGAGTNASCTYTTLK